MCLLNLPLRTTNRSTKLVGLGRTVLSIMYVPSAIAMHASYHLYKVTMKSQEANILLQQYYLYSKSTLFQTVTTTEVHIQQSLFILCFTAEDIWLVGWHVGGSMYAYVDLKIYSHSLLKVHPSTPSIILRVSGQSFPQLYEVNVFRG